MLQKLMAEMSLLVASRMVQRDSEEAAIRTLFAGGAEAKVENDRIVTRDTMLKSSRIILNQDIDDACQRPSYTIESSVSGVKMHNKFVRGVKVFNVLLP